MDTDCQVIQIKILVSSKKQNIKISCFVETKYNISNNEEKRRYHPFSKGKSKKVISFLKGEMDGRRITKFVTVRPKSCAIKIQKDECVNKDSEFFKKNQKA